MKLLENIGSAIEFMKKIGLFKYWRMIIDENFFGCFDEKLQAFF
jgi:hypothetical protein